MRFMSAVRFGGHPTRAGDANQKDDGPAEQRAYAGHVRFGDAVSVGAVALTPFDRAPLGMPNPGAGQFYLRYTDPRPAAAENDVPTREWGAKPDRMTGANAQPARQVRGRKYYWHADPTQQAVPRHIARPQQTNENLRGQRLLAATGTVLAQAVTFDNLTVAEVGSLFATLRPETVLPADNPGSRPLRLHLGGGKPLGLGSCHAEIERLRVWTAQSRYGPAAPVGPDPDGYVAAFVAAAPEAVSRTWPALCAVLAEDTVDPKQVWYPPGAHWSDQVSQGSRVPQKSFDEPFSFFIGTSGMYLDKKTPPRPLTPLPDPTAADQTLPITRAEDLGKGAAGGRK